MALATGFGCLFVGTGVNFAFGILFKPILAELGASRSALALAATASLSVNALLQPVLGHLVDRWGPRRVVLGGLALMAAGTLLVSQARSAGQLVLLYGVVAALGYTASGVLPVSVHVTRWFPGERGLVMAAVACGFSLGQLVMTQVAARLALGLGWRATYLVLGALLAGALAPLGRWFRDAPRDATAPGPPAPARDQARKPRMPGFFWLVTGLVGCGFTDFLLTTHLPPLVGDRGLPSTVAANALSLWAAANVAGLLLAGLVAARQGARLALFLTYAVRAGALAFLPAATEPWHVYAFAIAFGATFFTTAPLSATVVAQLAGPARQGSVLGTANLFHHLAGAAGAYAGGLAFDLTGGYRSILLASALLVAGSALASLRLPGPRPGCQP